MLSKRPILQLQKSNFDKTLEAMTFICVTAGWMIIAVSYATLPEIIPTHYDLKGNIDDHGSKKIIWILPFIFTAVITGIYFLNKYPHYFNYLVEINAENAEAQYKAATRQIRIILLGVALVFLTLVLDIIISAKSGQSFLGVWFVPVIVIAFTVPVLVSLFKSKRKRAGTPN